MEPQSSYVSVNTSPIDPDSLTESYKYTEQVEHERCRAFVLFGSFAVGIAVVTSFLFVYIGGVTTFAELGTLKSMQTSVMICMWVYTVCLVLTALYGVWTFYRFGGTQALIDHMQTTSDRLTMEADLLLTQTSDLTKSVHALSAVVDVSDKEQGKLNSILTTGRTMIRLEEKVTASHTDMKWLVDELERLQKLIHLNQRQVDKNLMMQKYYEIEQEDGTAGLNRDEYDLFMDQLDKQTRDTWREKYSFRKLSALNKDDRIVDAIEFQIALDDVFKRLDLEDQRAIAEFD
eukprot:192570_1